MQIYLYKVLSSNNILNMKSQVKRLGSQFFYDLLFDCYDQKIFIKCHWQFFIYLTIFTKIYSLDMYMFSLIIISLFSQWSNGLYKLKFWTGRPPLYRSLCPISVSMCAPYIYVDESIKIEKKGNFEMFTYWADLCLVQINISSSYGSYMY